MYAVVVTGGKQYKVEQGLIFKTEKLEVKKGDVIDLKPIMIGEDNNVLVGDAVKNAVVKAEVLQDNGKGPKIEIFKYKAKKNVRKRQGHRQPFTALKIVEIVKG